MRQRPFDFRARGRRVRIEVLGLCVALLAWLGAGCSRESSEPVAHGSELVIYAAASLRDAFTGIGADFRRLHPDAELVFNFAGSQELRTQLERGATADVFASADPHQMSALLARGLVTAPAITFARNEPVVIVTSEAQSTIRSFSELPNASRLVVGAPEVPIGRYTVQILERAARELGPDFRSRVEAKVVSRELNVRQVLAKVRLGEADAGVVYQSDARGVNGVTIVEIPSHLNAVAGYTIAVVSAAPQAALARSWVEHVSSPAGRAELARAGFLAATAAP